MVLLSRRVRAKDWKPIGVDGLETNALEVVCSTDNRSVIAGPGAGKTELLAQRASYLLQTGCSPEPQRILSISFKRDAATNLATRVRLRCHPDNASRFDSLTFDAFAKGLIDRFGQALPEQWRPSTDYEIMLPNYSIYRDFLDQLAASPSSIGHSNEISELNADRFERIHLIGRPLAVKGLANPTAAEWAAERFWHTSLHGGKKTYLSFPMIGRLAELLLSLNPLLRDALRLTYSHLFMDEFQDTTQVQYDLVRTIFLESDTVVTAVGDTKQQIMRWANAMDHPFDIFKSDFKAKSTPLLNNYRSSPELVRIQHILAQALDASAVKAVSKTKVTIDGDSCAIWNFSSPDIEAVRLADHIENSITSLDLFPRDFVLLVRQKAADYADSLASAFSDRGLGLRNEAASVGSIALQELLTEPVSHVFIRILRVATSERAGISWSECQKAISSLRGIDSDEEVVQTRLSHELDCFCREFQHSYPYPVDGEEEARKVVEAVQNFVGRDRLISAHYAYRQGNWFDKVTEAVIKHLCVSAADAYDWTETLDAYEGVHSVPLMTIHKSKGLQYHTVIFVGLDDSAWWSFTKDPIEGTAGFFVAFSRAEQRVIFTYCPSRGGKSKIATLYELLKSSGVEPVNLG